MASELPRFRQRSLSVVLAGALTCSLNLPAHATVGFAPPSDESESSPPASPDSDLPAEPASPRPNPPAVDERPSPASAPPLAAPNKSTVTVGPNTDYETFANSLPDDFDINYAFIAAREPEKEKSVRRLSDKQKSAMRSAGGIIMLLGIVTGGGMVGVGAFRVHEAKEKLSEPLYLDEQQQAIEKGKGGNTLLIAGGATAGGAFLLGLTLILAGRSKPGSDDSSDEARVQFAPMLNRSTTGASVRLRF